MSSTFRFGGAVIAALVFGIAAYFVLDGIGGAIVIGLCAAAGWLLAGVLFGRRAPRP